MDVLSEDYNKGASFALDTGGSLIKFVHKAKDNNDGSKLQVRAIPTHDWEQLVPILKELLPRRDTPEQETIFSTGLGVIKFQKKLEEELNVRIVSLSEFNCFAKAIVYMMKTHSTGVFCPFDDDAVRKGIDRGVRIGRMRGSNGRSISVDTTYQPPEMDTVNCSSEELLQKYGVQVTPSGGENVQPFIMATMGSGLGINKVAPSGEVSNVDLVVRAGRYFLGLGSLLAGKPSTFDELIEMAQLGDADKVDALLRHELAGSPSSSSSSPQPQLAGIYSQIPPDLYLYSFGQANRPDADIKACDKVAALLRELLYDTVQLVSHCAYGRGIRTIIFCGTFVTHPYVKRLLTEYYVEIMVQRPEGERQSFYILENGGYYGALGAWLTGAHMQAEHSL